MLRIEASHGFIKAEKFVPYSLFLLPFCKDQAGFHVSLSRERRLLGYSAIKSRPVMIFLLDVSLHRNSAVWSVVRLSYRGLSPLIAQFGSMANSRKSPYSSKLPPLKNEGGHCAHWDIP